MHERAKYMSLVFGLIIKKKYIRYVWYSFLSNGELKGWSPLDELKVYFNKNKQK